MITVFESKKAKSRSVKNVKDMKRGEIKGCMFMLPGLQNQASSSSSMEESCKWLLGDKKSNHLGARRCS